MTQSYLHWIPEHAWPLHTGDQKHWGNIVGDGDALAIANAARHHNGLTVAIVDSASAAQRLERQLQALLSDELPLLHFPDWETLPYDNFSPHEDIVSERLATLQQLPHCRRGVLVVAASTALHRLCPPSYIQGSVFQLRSEGRFEVHSQRQALELSGYRCVDTVVQHGEFAVRGAIIDIFPMGSKEPLRIELLDDEISTLRHFNPDSQRTTHKIEQIELLPAKEFPLSADAIRQFRSRWHAQFDIDHGRSPLYNDISQGIAPPGAEYYLPLFFEQTATLFDYLPSKTLLLVGPRVDASIEQFGQEVQRRYDELGIDPRRPLLPPNTLFLTKEQWFSRLNDWPRITLHSESLEKRAGRENWSLRAPAPLAIDSRKEDPLAPLRQKLANSPHPIVLCAESPGRREALLELLQRHRLQPQVVERLQDCHADSPLSLVVAPLEQGIDWPGTVELIAESQLFGQRVMQERRRRRQHEDSGESIIRNLTELNLGAPVVHIDHGVGRYRGLEILRVDDQPQEFLLLEYANEAKLYVPVAALHLISRYTGSDSEQAPLHKLGSDQWAKAKRKAAEQVRDVAAELLDIYARREARQGYTYSLAQDAYRTFAAGFPFEETPDQEEAINAVLQDMAKPQPMDRLVCGDVGFGKTEVAMRAAFVAVHAGRQVCVLVPTTLLAQQHYESFRDRFADWPVTVEVVSRFRSAKEQTQIRERLANGQIDILIGTHKLLSETLEYRDLGLVIVDEEHRFGVRQKERLKALRAEVDILTLTATPIPRTLNMAMSGLRELSVIATPPARRLSVKTFVRQHDKAVIKEAILREVMRGGQVYYLHNDVKTIELCARELQELLPEVRIAIGHGQMRERQLEQVMSDFYHRRFNVLVCSTIIETGIDVPNANTILIERADKFGLAQLHQLRGRVGRSHHQAYAYLLTPPPRSMTADAVKRLEAISAASDLGSGFMLATHDLEIRGAGELLGDEQSGQIQSVGFTLYMEMLERAVAAIKRGKTPQLDGPLETVHEINLHTPALIPNDYLPDVNVRLTLYKRIASANSVRALEELQVEMIDRFGLLPPPVKQLFAISQLRLDAEQLGVARIDIGSKGGKLEFTEQPNIDPIHLITLVQKQPNRFQFAGSTQLRCHVELPDPGERLQFVQQLLRQLAGRT